MTPARPGEDAPLALDDDSEPEPDLAMVPGEPRDYVPAHPSTAPLVVEVADSSLRLDRRLKAGLYARARIPDYWIVNLAERALEVHRDPAPAASNEIGWAYRSITRLTRPPTVSPLAAPPSSSPWRISCHSAAGTVDRVRRRRGRRLRGVLQSAAACR
jgi:Uma2 family endonuclease